MKRCIMKIGDFLPASTLNRMTDIQHVRFKKYLQRHGYRASGSFGVLSEWNRSACAGNNHRWKQMLTEPGDLCNTPTVSGLGRAISYEEVAHAIAEFSVVNSFNWVIRVATEEDEKAAMVWLDSLDVDYEHLRGLSFRPTKVEYAGDAIKIDQFVYVKRFNVSPDSMNDQDKHLLRTNSWKINLSANPEIAEAILTWLVTIFPDYEVEDLLKKSEKKTFIVHNGQELDCFNEDYTSFPLIHLELGYTVKSCDFSKLIITRNEEIQSLQKQIAKATERLQQLGVK